MTPQGRNAADRSGDRPRRRRSTARFEEGRTPSLYVYDDPVRGWYCYASDRGGTIIDLVAALYDIEPQGQGFHDIRRRAGGPPRLGPGHERAAWSARI